MSQDPAQHSLDVLWTMVTAVLVQSAKVFKEPSKHDEKNVVHTNTQLKQVTQGALGRFHGALDVLEIEILRAKAALQRDLAVARANRIKREGAAIAEAMKSKGPGSSVVVPGPALATDQTAVSVLTHSELTDASAEPPQRVGGSVTLNTDAATSKNAATSVSVPLTEVATQVIPPLDVTIPHATGGLSAHGSPANPSHKSLPAPMATLGPSSEATPAAAGPLVTEAKEVLPPSTILNNSDACDTNMMDVDLAFSNHDTGNLGLHGMHGASHKHELSALLPGLESYANNSNQDIDLLGAGVTSALPLPPTSTIEASPIVPTANMAQMTYDLTGGAPESIAAASTNIDDLYFDEGQANFGVHSGGVEGGDNGKNRVEGMDMMDFDSAVDHGGEFDDALFGFDEN